MPNNEGSFLLLGKQLLNQKVVGYTSKYKSLRLEEVSDPAALLFSSRTSRGRPNRAWPKKTELQGMDLGLVSCFVTEIF